MERHELADALCLLRFLPLLAALESPVHRFVEAVADALIEGRRVPDDVLIALDEYREAVTSEVLEPFEPTYFPERLCTMSLCAAGAGPIDGSLLQKSQALWADFYRNVVAPRVVRPGRSQPEFDTLWQSFTEHAHLSDDLAEPEGQRLDFDTLWPRFAAFATGQDADTESALARLLAEECDWTAMDDQVVAVAEQNPAAVGRHIMAMREQSPSRQERLAAQIAELGWDLHGPCGPPCDWPACESAAERCLSRRPFKRQQTLAASLRRKHGEPAQHWFVRVIIHGARAGEPRAHLIEFDAGGREARKIIQYVGRPSERMDAGGQSDAVVPVEGPVVSLADLRGPRRTAEEISGDTFDDVWHGRAEKAEW